MLLLLISAFLLVFSISCYKIYKGFTVLKATPAYVPKGKLKQPFHPKQDLSGFPTGYF
jgi:hypothetical protein